MPLAAKTDLFSGLDALRNLYGDVVDFPIAPLEADLMLTALNGDGKRDRDFLLDRLRLRRWASRLSTSEWVTASASHATAHLAQDVFHPAATKQLTDIDLGTTAAPAEWIVPALEWIAATHPFEVGTELVVHLSFFSIAKHIVSLLDLLKLFLGTFLFPWFGVFVQVRMVFSRQFSIRLLNLLRGSATRKSKNLVIVVCHPNRVCLWRKYEIES